MAPLPSSDPSGSSSSVTRGLSVFRAVLEAGHSRAATIAERTGLPLSTVYRHLRDLVDHEFVAERNGGYEAGAALGTSAGALSDRALAEMSMPILRRLSAVSGETALGVVRHGLHGVVYAQAESTQIDRVAYGHGTVLPLHAGAAQRVILSHAGEPVLREILSRGLHRQSAGSLNETDLVRSLDQIRRTGYAVSTEELTPGGLAIAVPVFVQERAHCSLCLQGPLHRCTPTWQAAVLPLLREAAVELADLVASACLPIATAEGHEESAHQQFS